MQRAQPTHESVRVVVADSSPIHSQLLAEAIGRHRHIKVVGSTANCPDVIKTVLESRPDVLLLSTRIEEESNRGFEVLQQLRIRQIDVKAVMLLDSHKPDTIVQAFRLGVRGVFSRSSPVKMLCKCIVVVHEGQIWANTEELRFVMAAMSAVPPPRSVDSNALIILSQREREVVNCLVDGLTNRGIAQRLGISVHTVKNYLFRIFDKLGVSSRLELFHHVVSQPGGAHHPNSRQERVALSGKETDAEPLGGAERRSLGRSAPIV